VLVHSVYVYFIYIYIVVLVHSACVYVCISDDIALVINHIVTRVPMFIYIRTTKEVSSSGIVRSPVCVV
jgi:hypothetical protein